MPFLKEFKVHAPPERCFRVDETADYGGLNSRAMVVRILDVELTLAFIDLLEFIS